MGHAQSIYKIQPWQLQFRQRLPLWVKVEYAQKRIIDWYKQNDGAVYVAFSGGKDSTVLLHLVRELYPDVPAVFVNTGLEYPEIVQFVKETENVVWLRPKMSFKRVLEKYGYPVLSKLTARKINTLQNARPQNAATCHLYRTGIKKDGTRAKSFKLAAKWMYLIDSGIPISNYCCDVIKKQPFRAYVKESGRKPFVGTMASDSMARRETYLKKGCNSTDGKTPMSLPISCWVEADIWEYLRTENISYSTIYDLGEKRTGCMFCMFGIHLEKGENRFQRMKRTHPKQYDYCINKLGIGHVLDTLNIDY